MRFEDNATHVYLSRRNSGKSHLCRHILASLVPNLDEVFIISQTERVSHSFDCFDDAHIRDSYEPNFVLDLMKKQEIRVKKMGKDKAPKILLILDDVIGTLKPDEANLNRIFTMGRHINLAVCVLLQYSKKCMSPIIRANVDYLFINRLPDQGMRNVYETVHYPGGFRKFQQFLQEKQKDKPYTFLLYNSLTKQDSERWQCVTAPEQRAEFSIVYSRADGADGGKETPHTKQIKKK